MTSVDEILENTEGIFLYEERRKAQKQSLEALLLKSLPEKRPKTIKTWKDFDYDDPRHRYVHGVDVGFNHALDKVTNIIEEVFK